VSCFCRPPFTGVRELFVPPPPIWISGTASGFFFVPHMMPLSIREEFFFDSPCSLSSPCSFSIVLGGFFFPLDPFGSRFAPVWVPPRLVCFPPLGSYPCGLTGFPPFPSSFRPATSRFFRPFFLSPLSVHHPTRIHPPPLLPHPLCW